MMALNWSQALAWRMRRQLLDPVGTESVVGVVRRLGAIPAQLDAAAELAVRARRERSRPGEVSRAVAEGPDHQDVRVPRRHPPDDPRGQWHLPRLAGSQSDVRAAQLGDLLWPGTV